MKVSSPLLQTFIDELLSVMPELDIRADADSLNHYGRDWTRVYEPKPAMIILPVTVQQVQLIVLKANFYNIALVPSGGRTGLSGGAVASNGEVVVSFEKMNRVLGTDLIDRTVTVQSGVVTAQIQEVATGLGLYYPVDFASSGSSQIGGNIATNAGGIKVLRYGLTRDWITGLKVVTGAGEILELNQGLIKNATGYDIRHLFIGSEGTLGFVVEATVQLTCPPKPLKALVVGVPDLAVLMKVLHRFQQHLELTAFEFFSEAALLKVLKHSDLQRPFAEQVPFYALLEVEAWSSDAEQLVLEQFEACMEEGWVVNGVISQNETQLENLWALRERISESIAQYTPYKNDISVRISRVPSFLAEIDKLVLEQYPDFEVIWFGHIGDGNLHLNILKPDTMEKSEFFAVCTKVSEKIYKVVESFEGSISAEHGVGLIKKSALPSSRSIEQIQLMQNLKAIFDPKGIMNPGKLV